MVKLKLIPAGRSNSGSRIITSKFAWMAVLVTELVCGVECHVQSLDVRPAKKRVDSNFIT